AFFGSLALLIAGNGFFKPNISTIVGSLYPAGSPKRDSGFTLFYMGINLGAAMSPLLCGYVGETYGWHYGFGLATVGMLTGLTVFVAPIRVTQIVIAIGALAGAGALVVLRPDNPLSFVVNLFVGAALLFAAVVSWIALARGGLPLGAGAPPDLVKLRAPSVLKVLTVERAIYVGTLLVVPVLALVVSGFSPFTADHAPLVLFSESVIARLSQSPNAFEQILGVVVKEVSKPAGLILAVTGMVALGYLGKQMLRLARPERERMQVVLILTFFSMLFWSFFEQAGSSINNFTDRNVDRVGVARVVNEADVGRTVRLQPTQAQIGHENAGRMFTMRDLDDLRAKHTADLQFEIDWQVGPSNLGMAVARRSDEVPASVFQSTNPILILLFGLVFTALWTYLGQRGREPSTPFKFAMGLLQLGLGFGAIWLGTKSADSRGMVAAGWLLLGYFLHTSGELCLSPVGLSMITRMTPRLLVSTVMGTWFLATAFSQYLAAIISQFTGVGHGGGDDKTVPIPRETLHVYGTVFGKIALFALLSAAVCFLLIPVLKRWMHEEKDNAQVGV
ncbi:MAG: hypothetical protein H7X95_11060, partial [Deltaproteobacteria bacterium]|nr:hypothetical protein [Deltaproteobacteria bacterium]